MRAARLLGAIGWIALASSGCGGSAAIRNTPPPSCETRVPAVHPADTVTVVVFDKIDLAHAPWGQNREERFVFSHLYETLVTIDCHGVVQPGLAKSWKPGSDGWLVELRDGAKFWDESPVTARDVVESFGPALRSGLAIASVDVVDETHVLVRGERRPPDIKLLALPMTAIRNDSGTSGYPMGTGAWQIDDGIPVAEAVAISPVLVHSPVVRFVLANPSDAMDLVSGKADAMITDDPAVIDYARAKPHVTLAPLAWDRAYVLLSTTRSRNIDHGAGVADLPRTVCDALARDAVHVDARGGGSLVVDAVAASTKRVIVDFGGEAAAGPFNPIHRVLFVAGDPTSRGLAERIVALAAMDTSLSGEARAIVRAMPGAAPDLRAASVDVGHFESSLREGSEFAYILPLSWCADFPFFATSLSAVWLCTNPPLAPRVVPLVETRAHFIAMSDRIAFSNDGAGNVHILVNPGPRR